MELKLPEIKLFGKKIPLPENKRFGVGDSDGGIGNENRSGSNSNCSLNHMKVSCIEENEVEYYKDVNKQEADKIKDANPTMFEKLQIQKDLSTIPDTASLDRDSTGKQSRDSESNTNNSQTKNPKKPDKIVPCPRCESMETKFCYYNNYKVNQPRHYCKSCQRYWTAGGIMRNVPMGAGRRKNKNSSARFDSTVRFGFHRSSFKSNGTVLSFGPESALNKKNVTNKNDLMLNSNQEIPVPIPYYPNVNCPYPNPGSIPIPSICSPDFQMPFYTVPLWDCGIPSHWSYPCLPPISTTHKPSGELLTIKNGNESNDPKSLEGSILVPKTLRIGDPKESLEGSILVPKTLRIGDPKEAAMSSIWTTLGIKSDTPNRELFKAFQPKNNEKKHVTVMSSLSQANPAAVSRSLNFRETI